MEIIEIRVISKSSAIEINSMNANRQFSIQELMLGSGTHRKPVKYEQGMLKYGSEHKAEILENGKLRIV